MAITLKALKAFRDKGYAVSSKIKGRASVAFKHAVFSGYANIDTLADHIKVFVEAGCIVQPDSVKGYFIFSYPADQPNMFNEIRHALYETGNHLRFIGYSDRMLVNL